MRAGLRGTETPSAAGDEKVISVENTPARRVPVRKEWQITLRLDLWTLLAVATVATVVVNIRIQMLYLQQMSDIDVSLTPSSNIMILPILAEQVAATSSQVTALLISGQRRRFIYRDGNYKLASDTGVFVRLQDWDTNSAPKPWAGDTPEKPPYGVEAEQVVSYFHHIGAGYVQLQMMSHANVTKLCTKMEALLKKLGHVSDRDRLQGNMKMLLLRHLVYQDMLTSGVLVVVGLF